MPPTHPAPRDQARIALAAGDAATALACLAGLPEENRDAETWCLIGAARLDSAMAAEALEAFAQAARLHPAHSGAANGAAAALVALGRHGEATEHLIAHLRVAPGDVDALVNLAVIEVRTGSAERGLVLARQAAEAAPGNAAAWNACGEALLDLARPAEAAQAWARVCALAPGSVRHWFNLAEAQLAADDYAAAREAYDLALRRDPAFNAARVGRAMTLAMDGRHAAADEEFQRLEADDPATLRSYFANMARAAGQAVPPCWRPVAVEMHAVRLAHRLEGCDWDVDAGAQALFGQLAARARAGAGLHDPALVFHALHVDLAEEERACIAGGVARVIRAGHPARSGFRTQGRKIRLGIVTPNVRDHPSTQIQWRRLALHDRTQFEIFAYALTEPDGSELASRFQAACDVFRPMAGANPDAVAWRIARDGVAILMDVSGHFEHSRPEIFALRPAPLNVSYLGMPASLGLGIVDYRISDRICTPDGLLPAWPEALIRVPATHFIYNDREPVAEEPQRRSDWGLPETAVVFCCFNSAAKYDPDSFAAWMSILAQVPAGVLWLLDPGAPSRGRLVAAAGRAGIAPHRLVFAARIPRARHLARLRCADLFLDTFRYGAHTTAADALWAGLPVITRTGQTMASRLGSSIVAAAGTPELATPDTAGFVALACRLAEDGPARQAIGKRLAPRQGALFDTVGRVRDLDQALMLVWDRHRRGHRPASFDLESP